MPTFPIYHGETPLPLNPLNVRHYLLLASWLYFRPTALKYYLHQAAPEIYQQGPMVVNFRQTWRVPAYRSLYLMIGTMALLLPVLAALLVVLATSWLQGTPVDWWAWGNGVAGAVAAVIIGGVAGSVTVIVAGSVVFGVVLGLAVSVAVGAAGPGGERGGGGGGGIGQRRRWRRGLWAGLWSNGCGRVWHHGRCGWRGGRRAGLCGDGLRRR